MTTSSVDYGDKRIYKMLKKTFGPKPMLIILISIYLSKLQMIAGEGQVFSFSWKLINLIIFVYQAYIVEETKSTEPFSFDSVWKD